MNPTPFPAYPDRDDLKQDYPEIDDEDIRQALEFAAISLDDQILTAMSSSAGQW